MKWNYDNYEEWINQGHPINAEVLELDISFSMMTSLEPVKNLINLKVLNCSYNKINSLEPIKELTNLKVLYCYSNKIRSLEPIKNLINLKVLNCSHNKIKSLEMIKNLINLEELSCVNNKIRNLGPINNLTSLEELYCGFNKILLVEPIKNLINLKVLDCHNNQIQSLEPIKNLIKLEELYCSSNKILLLEPLRNLINLKHFYCSSNQIQSLEPINNLINLENLDCYSNQIQSLEPINNLINLQLLYYSNNQIEYTPPNIVRRLDRIMNGQNIYNDSENVHNHNIQECVRKSIQNILNIKPIIINVYDYILNDDIFTSKTKEILLDHINCKDVHCTLNITFEELLLHVINRIEKSEYKLEIKNILNVEMLDSECKCFTGRISRLINCLNGFDELVKINISENEQIGQIISLVRNELILKGKYTIENHKSIVKEELLNREYLLETINEWINFIE